MIIFVQKTATLITSSANQPIAVAAAGVEFSVGVTYQGQVVAWGSQEFGQVRIAVAAAGVRVFCWGDIPGTSSSLRITGVWAGKNP